MSSPLTHLHLDAVATALDLTPTQRVKLHQRLAEFVAEPTDPIAAAAAKARQSISPLKACEDSKNLPLLREAVGQCRELNFRLDLASDRPVNLWELDAAFAAKADEHAKTHRTIDGMPDRLVEQRIRAKRALSVLRLI